MISNIIVDGPASYDSCLHPPQFGSTIF